jgi:hypothetical protein
VRLLTSAADRRNHFGVLEVQFGLIEFGFLLVGMACADSARARMTFIVCGALPALRRSALACSSLLCACLICAA